MSAHISAPFVLSCKNGGPPTPRVFDTKETGGKRGGRPRTPLNEATSLSFFQVVVVVRVTEPLHYEVKREKGEEKGGKHL